MYRVIAGTQYLREISDLLPDPALRERVSRGIEFVLERDPTIDAYNVDVNWWTRRVTITSELKMLIYYEVNVARQQVRLVSIRLAPPIVPPM